MLADPAFVGEGAAVAEAVEAAAEVFALLLLACVCVGVALVCACVATLCPGVVYNVPKSGAGNGPVYSSGTFTTE